MKRGYLTKLTLALYKVTELFPENEPLKFFLRQRANKIMSDSVLIFSKNPISLTKKQEAKIRERVSGDIKIIQRYFEIAKDQGWVDKRNFSVLEREYDRLGKRIREGKEKGSLPMEPKSQPLKIEKESLPNERCKKILDFLREKDRAQIWELKEIFTDISKRTLRRDFDYLMANGLVKRIGEGRQTFYRINRTEQF